MALAASPDDQTLYVALPGINAIAVVALDGTGGEVKGLIPTAWYPSSVKVSGDGRTLYVANARGHGAGPNNAFLPDNLGSPKHSTLGTVSVIPVPREVALEQYTTLGCTTTACSGPPWRLAAAAETSRFRARWVSPAARSGTSFS